MPQIHNRISICLFLHSTSTQLHRYWDRCTRYARDVSTRAHTCTYTHIHAHTKHFRVPSPLLSLCSIQQPQFKKKLRNDPHTCLTCLLLPSSCCGLSSRPHLQRLGHRQTLPAKSKSPEDATTAERALRGANSDSAPIVLCSVTRDPQVCDVPSLRPPLSEQPTGRTTHGGHVRQFIKVSWGFRGRVNSVNGFECQQVILSFVCFRSHLYFSVVRERWSSYLI